MTATPSKQGCDVVLDSQSYKTPRRCASCGAAQQTTLETKKSQNLGTRTQTFAVPYCHPCAQRVRAVRYRRRVFAAETCGIAFALAALGFLVPQLPLAVLVGVPTVVAVAFAVAAMTVFAPRAPDLPAIGVGEAVKLISFQRHRYVLHCVNAEWGGEFAHVNRVAAVPRHRSFRFATSSLVIAVCVAPLAAFLVWDFAHPQVHIDNAGSDPIQIWLDGQPSKVVQPSDGDSERFSRRVPPRIWVAYGTHQFGYSKVGATRPEAVIEANVTMRDEHLYNPGKTACYELVADRYGAASTDGVLQGPQPQREFYAFHKVDTWFADNPETVQVSSGSKGDVKVALQRALNCPRTGEQRR